MQTNKPLTNIVNDGTGDEALWNIYLQADRDVQQQGGGVSAWFVSPWLLTECYFYRCIISAIRSRYVCLIVYASTNSLYTLRLACCQTYSIDRVKAHGLHYHTWFPYG